MAAHRVRAASGGSLDPSVIPLRNGLKNAFGSIGCKATEGDLHPSQFDVPFGLLGRGHRWPHSPKIERKIWEAILWREGCAP